MVISVGPTTRGGFGRQTQILSAKAQQHHWEGTGPLSVKTFFNGQAHYRVGRGVYALSEHSYLVLNHGRTYAISIDSVRPVESFCVFFRPGFVEDVHGGLVRSSARLLDEPEARAIQHLNFFERIYPGDDFILRLYRLRDSWHWHKDDPGWLEERLHELAHELLRAHRKECRRAEALAAVRPGTREELYRRLNRARDYAHSLFHQPLTLTDLAQVACLSPNHFLRMFKQAFGQTPHQFLIDIRLEAARKMLRETDRSITDICFAVGFQSLGSFSWLFRKRFRVAPSEWQKR